MFNLTKRRFGSIPKNRDEEKRSDPERSLKDPQVYLIHHPIPVLDTRYPLRG